MDSDFIKKFEDLIKEVADKSRELVIPMDKAIGELIPNIHIDSNKLSPKELTFLSMNMDNFKWQNFNIDKLLDSVALKSASTPATPASPASRPAHSPLLTRAILCF